MLVKNENEWCCCFGGYVGYPQKSMEDAVNDFAKIYPDVEVQKVRVGNPYYAVIATGLMEMIKKGAL